MITTKKNLGKAALAGFMSAALLTTSALAIGRPVTGGTAAGGDARLVISQAGTYTLTGSMRGSVYVDPGAGDVKLILDNAIIDGGRSAGIIAASGDRLTIETAVGSVNRVNDSGTGSAISSAVDLRFQGGGQLVATSGGEAIRADAGYAVHGGELVANGERLGPMVTNTASRGGVGGLLSGLFQSIGNFFRGLFTPAANEQQPQQQPAADVPQQPAQQGGASKEPVQQQPSQQPGTQQGNASSEPAQQQPGTQQGNASSEPAQRQPSQQQGNASGEPAQQQNGASGELQGTVDAPNEIVTSTIENTALALEADYDNAATFVMSDEDSQVKITEAGTYIVTGSSSNGNIVVKKGTTGVVLVLDNLDLTSVTGATLSVNKEAEVKIVVSGNVTLTDAEDPAAEDSADADVADAYDGAAIKVKANSVAVITGDGTLNINGAAKNGIKAGDDSSLVIDGDVTVNITAVNDGINSNYDVTILDGDITIDAGDDGIHADHILTIGDEETGSGPDLTVTDSEEGLEGTVVNIFGGDIDVTSSDDAINAANADGAYEGELEYSINMTGGDVTINSRGDGMDSNGNVNLIGGSADIHSASMGGEAGIDYDGELYISEDFQLNNQSGVAGPDGMPGQMGPGGSGEMGRR